MRYLKIMLLLFLLPTMGFAQDFVQLWKTELEAKRNFHFHKILEQWDGNLVAIGEGVFIGSKDVDGAVVLLNQKNGKSNARRLGRNGVDYFTDGIRTMDGGFILAGIYSDKGKKAFRFVKVDEHLGLIWEETFGNATPGQKLFVEPAANDHFYLAYQQEEEVVMLKTDGIKKIFEQRYGAEKIEKLVDFTTDWLGNILLLAETKKSSDTKKGDFWLASITPEGELNWEKSYGEKDFENPMGVRSIADGNVVVYGKVWTRGLNEDIFWLVINADGKVVKDGKYKGKGSDYPVDLVESPKGQFNIFGGTKSLNLGIRVPNAFVCQTDYEGYSSFPSLLQDDEKSRMAGPVLETYDQNLAIILQTEAASREPVTIQKFDHLPKTQEKDTTAPNLSMRYIKTVDLSGDYQLQQGERGYALMEIQNKGVERSSAAKLEILPGDRDPNLDCWPEVMIPELRGGERRQIPIPFVVEGGKAKYSESLNLQITKFGRILNSTTIDIAFAQKRPAETETTPSPEPETTSVPTPEPAPATKEEQVEDTLADLVWLKPDPLENNLQQLTVLLPYQDIELRASSTIALTQDNFQLFCNGQRIDRGGKLKSNQIDNQFNYAFSMRVPLEEGENKVEIKVAANGRMVQAFPLKISYKAEKPDLHLLAIGPSYADLQYTNRDAEEFAAAFEGQSGEEKLYQNVYLDVLTGKYYTEAEDIKKKILELKQRREHREIERKITPNDILLVFISSHGKLVKGELKLLPSDYKEDFGDLYAIDYNRDIIDPINAIDCKKIVFLDACHSGSGSKNELADQDLSAMLNTLNAQVKDATVITSCKNDELSYEDATWGNGAFTAALLEALRGDFVEDETGIYIADRNNDDQLTLHELYQFLQRRVPDMVKQVKGESFEQHPYLSKQGIEMETPLFIID